MIEPIASIAQIERQAKEAADNNRGSIACHYPVESKAFAIWMDAYYVRLKSNSEQVAA